MWIGCVLLAGCEPIPLAEYLEVACPGPATIDTNCNNGGCDGVDGLEVSITWPDNPLFTEGSQIELTQYLVSDYVIPGIDGDIPWYAADFSQLVTLGSTSTFLVIPAGSATRDMLQDAVPNDSVYIGTAVIEFAGYDQVNAPVTGITGTFQVVVGDLSALGTPTLPTTPTSATGPTSETL